MSDYIRRNTSTPWDEDDDVSGLAQAAADPLGWPFCLALAVVLIGILGVVAGLLVALASLVTAIGRWVS